MAISSRADPYRSATSGARSSFPRSRPLRGFFPLRVSAGGGRSVCRAIWGNTD